MGDFDGLVALITGGARGMGRSHAVALAEAGADIAICDRCENNEQIAYPLATESDLAATTEMVEAAGRRCLTAKLSTSDRGALERFVADVESGLGRLDIAVTNAGVSAIAMLPDVPSAQWDEVIGSNLTGTFNTIAAVAPGMIARGYGRIVTVSSMLGRSGNFGQAAYAASKWGVIGLTKVAAHDLAGFGITVNAVAPGPTATALFLNGKTEEAIQRMSKMAPLERLGTPDDIAAAVAFLAGPDGRWVNGQTLRANGGLV